MKNKYIIMASLLVILSGASAALEAHVVTSGPTEVNDMIYTWGSSDTTPYYQDAQAYEDVGLMICSDSGTPSDKYLGLEYMMNSAYDLNNQLVSYGEENLAIADKATSFNGKDCKRTSFGSFVVSPSVISGTPQTKIAAMPAEAFVLASESIDGSNPEFLETNSELAGSYSGSASYIQSGNQLNLNLNSITVNSDQGLRSFEPDNTGRGISQERPVLIGMCMDPHGQDCPSGVEKITSPSSSNTNFEFDVAESKVNDSVTYTRYAVANGKSFDTIEIGADIDVFYTSVSNNPIYYSQNQTVSFDLRNTGNVPITSEFEIEADIEKNGEIIDSRTFVVSDGLDLGESKSFNYEWQALEESGDYNVNIRSDTGDSITEIDENNNNGYTGFELRPVTFPKVIVNGETVPEEEIEFPDTGVPYNLTLIVENSDNETLSDSLIRIRENNPTNSLIPTQRLDQDTVTDSNTEVVFRTGENGTASITIIPRGNVLLSEKYSDLDVQQEIDYFLRMSGEQQDGTDFRFMTSDGLQDFYPLEVENPGTMSGNGTSDLPNLNSYAKITMNGIYNIFAEFWGAVT